MSIKRFNLHKLKYERNIRNVAVDELSDALKITTNAYYRKENGSVNITVEELAVILDVLKINLNNVGMFYE